MSKPQPKTKEEVAHANKVYRQMAHNALIDGMNKRHARESQQRKSENERGTGQEAI